MYIACITKQSNLKLKTLPKQLLGSLQSALTLPGQMSVGLMSVGQMSVGQMSVSQMSVGQMSVGQMFLTKRRVTCKKLKSYFQRQNHKTLIMQQPGQHFLFNVLTTF